jgi:hypothetical protein
MLGRAPGLFQQWQRNIPVSRALSYQECALPPSLFFFAHGINVSKPLMPENKKAKIRKMKKMNKSTFKSQNEKERNKKKKKYL